MQKVNIIPEGAVPRSSAPRAAFVWLDAIRFLAAFVVVVAHARSLYWLDTARTGTDVTFRVLSFFAGFGHEAVIIFFVLSGYWITRSVDRSQNVSDFWQAYLSARLSRLMIVLVPALAVGGTIDLVFSQFVGGPYYSGTSGAVPLQHAVTESLDPLTLLGNLAFTQGQLVAPFGSNGPLWSLANEFWYYLWFPALFLMVKRRDQGLMAVSLLAALLMPGLLPGFLVWLIGSLLYFADKHLLANGAHFQPYSSVILAIALVLFAAIMAGSRMNLLPRSTGTDLAIAASFALVVARLLATEPQPHRWLAPFSAYGSRASYSLYVTHFPIQVAFASLITSGPMRAPDIGLLPEFAATIALALVWGWLFASFTEAHTERLRHWVWLRTAGRSAKREGPPAH